MPGLEILPPPTDEAGRVATKEPELNNEPLRIVLTSLDKNIDAFAREEAHERLSKKPEGPLWKRMVKGVWDNLSHEYQVVRETQKARQEIQSSGNLLHHHDKSDSAWREATVNRYASEYGEQLVREGETFHRLGQVEAVADPQAQRIRGDVFGTVRGIVKGEIPDEESLEDVQRRTNHEWNRDKVAQGYIGEGNLLAHNIWAMGLQVKAALDSVEGLSDLDRDAKLEEILAKTEIITGEAKVGSTVEIESTISEKLAAKLEKVPFLNEGRLAQVVSAVTNETTIAALLSVATYGVKNRLSEAATAVIIPGLGGGIVAGLRERRALKKERA